MRFLIGAIISSIALGSALLRCPSTVRAECFGSVMPTHLKNVQPRKQFLLFSEIASVERCDYYGTSYRSVDECVRVRNVRENDGLQHLEGTPICKRARYPGQSSRAETARSSSAVFVSFPDLDDDKSRVWSKLGRSGRKQGNLNVQCVHGRKYVQLAKLRYPHSQLPSRECICRADRNYDGVDRWVGNGNGSTYTIRSDFDMGALDFSRYCRNHRSVVGELHCRSSGEWCERRDVCGHATRTRYVSLSIGSVQCRWRAWHCEGGCDCRCNLIPICKDVTEVSVRTLSALTHLLFSNLSRRILFHGSTKNYYRAVRWHGSRDSSDTFFGRFTDGDRLE